MPAPSRSLPRVLSAAGADRLGFTPARTRTELRRGRWQRLGPGVLLTRPDLPTRPDWIQAGTIIAGDDAVLSGWDAVRLRGLGPDRAPTSRVLLLTNRGRHRVIGHVQFRPSEREVMSTQLSALDETLPGVRIAATQRAVADTALECHNLHDVRAMVTSAIQRRLCTPEDLVRELDCGPRNGSALLRTALADVLDGAHSIAEGQATQLLRQAGIVGWKANAPIPDAAGRPLFRVDLLWPALRAIVEIDSREFHFSEVQWKATMRRHNALTSLGYVVAHYPPSDIRSRGLAWAREVARWLDARAAWIAVEAD